MRQSVVMMNSDQERFSGLSGLGDRPCMHPAWGEPLRSTINSESFDDKSSSRPSPFGAANPESDRSS